MVYWRKKGMVGYDWVYTTKIPVRHKKILQIVYGWSIYSQVCISPVKFSRILFILIPVYIFIANVNATNKCCASIYYHDLPVITIIEPVGQQVKTNLMKRVNFNACLTHFPFCSFLY